MQMKTSVEQYQELQEIRRSCKNQPSIRLPNGQVMTSPYAPMFYAIRRSLAESDRMAEIYTGSRFHNHDSFVIERLDNLEASGIRLGLITGNLLEALKATPH